MSPAKIAIADIVMIAAMAGTGSRKKVKGTSRAAASVAVIPGSAPITSPNTADSTTTRIVVGSATSSRALSTSWIISEPPDQAVGELHQQHLLEQPPQPQGGQDAGEDRCEPGGPE